MSDKMHLHGKELAKKGTQFSKDYQPSPEAKAAGAKKFWQYRRARREMFERLCNVELPNGKQINFWDEIKKKLQFVALSSDSPLTEKEKVELMMRMIKEFMPEEDKRMELDVKAPVIVISQEDAKL